MGRAYLGGPYVGGLTWGGLTWGGLSGGSPVYIAPPGRAERAAREQIEEAANKKEIASPAELLEDGPSAGGVGPTARRDRGVGRGGASGYHSRI